MNQPTPAIVAQEAVRRLPRVALLLFCVAYVLPGFVGRDPWKSADITGFGHMAELARGASSWLSPTLLGRAPEFDALLPYWLGAWAIKLAPAWVAPDFAARVPFILLLALTLAATWYGVYYLARSPLAQPVPFAFGGEARPSDYARAIADGGLLALVACLGLAQFSHETTPSLAQLAFTAISFFGIAALPYRPVAGALGLICGLVGMALSGAPSMAMLFGAGGLALAAMNREATQSFAVVAAMVLSAALATWLGLWQWRVDLGVSSHQWHHEVRLFAWFAWPAWPLALWTLWRWRWQVASVHVALPLWFVLAAIGTMLMTPTSDRSLLLALPALAALAAFALPTFSRSASAVIDWFTLIFFSVCAIAIWVIWFSLQTGVPAKPAANIARLAPGFTPSFSFVALGAALLATFAWAWLVRWRTGRHRPVIWKSLVLPASGTALCWLLLMTLGLPVLDYARSYTPLVRNVQKIVTGPGCVEELGLSPAQLAAFTYHGEMELRSASRDESCPWLLIAAPVQPAAHVALDMKRWRLVADVRRPSDKDENVLVYKRVSAR